jgi:5-methyltetrahydrofolate--homocysteine methyltransferase
MILVGELINASRKAVAAAIEVEDAYTIKKMAIDQAAAGAAYIDVNAGIFVEREPACLAWMVPRIQSVVDIPCCIDSPSPEAIEAALTVHKGRAMINSISLERRRFDALLPLVAGSDLQVVALCMSDDGMPDTADQRLAIADRLVNRLVQHGVAPTDIFVDPLVQPLSTDSSYGIECLVAIRRIMVEFEPVHTICGLSNISYGLPRRRLLNRTFVSMAAASGLDSAIVDPLDKGVMDAISAAAALSGRDDHCLEYIQRHRHPS